MATVETEAIEAGELALVRAWRLEKLEQSGYDPWLASELAERVEIDLLLRRGCSQELAGRILL